MSDTPRKETLDVNKACVKVVEGGVPETTALLKVFLDCFFISLGRWFTKYSKERFDYIFYTGSTPVGRIVG